MNRASRILACLMLVLPIAAPAQETNGNYPFVYITDEAGNVVQGPERTNVVPLWPVRSCFGWSVVVPGPDREVDLAVTDMEGAEFAAIERSLQRLAAGSYGECVDCGALVPFKRLELEPHAERCVACAAKLERHGPRPPSM